MLQSNLLRAKIAERELRISDVAREVNLSYYGFHLKLKGIREFKLSEIERISDFLKISPAEREKIFFA